jgi:aldehyde:ferredoxin oxidoreductase
MLEEPIMEHNILPVGSNLDLMLDQYYQARGWDLATAVPKRETLLDLGLEFAADDMPALVCGMGDGTEP